MPQTAGGHVRTAEEQVLFKQTLMQINLLYLALSVLLLVDQSFATRFWTVSATFELARRHLTRLTGRVSSTLAVAALRVVARLPSVLRQRPRGRERNREAMDHHMPA